jgi:hypothetical protein
MERSEEGDAREIAAWQIAVVLAIGNYVFESLQHLVTKSIPVQILSIRSFRLAGVFFK